MGGATALNNWFSYGDKEGIVNHLTANNLTDRYIEAVFYEISLEVEQLRKYVGDSSLNRIVSVGPGNGLIELFLLKEGLTSEILLIDIENTVNHHHGFALNGSGYANLEATKSFIQKNVNAKVQICNPQKETLPDFEFTLFISLLSMGFHYPCNEYAPFIKANALKNAFIVFDSRKDVDNGVATLLETFTAQDVIEGPKSARLFLTRS